MCSFKYLLANLSSMIDPATIFGEDYDHIIMITHLPHTSLLCLVDIYSKRSVRRKGAKVYRTYDKPSMTDLYDAVILTHLIQLPTSKFSFSSTLPPLNPLQCNGLYS